MIPLELSIEGLYSYRLKTNIDFSPFIEAGLFGIFGPVGSGKSTILDGISLALYGESDRLSGREKKNYNLMNLQSNSLRIGFRCLHEGDEYLFTMEGDRNRRNYNEVRNIKRRVYRRADGEWIPMNDAGNSVSAEDVLGIGYRNFFRTIIIPQGKFQEFLQLQPAKRRDMMQELFHLDRYDLYSPAKRLMGASLERRNILRGRLDQLADVNAGALRSLKKELSETEALLEQCGVTKSELQHRLNQFDEMCRINRELHDLHEEEKQLLSREQEMSARREALEEYIDCFYRFRPPLKNLEERIEEYRAARRELKDDLSTECQFKADERRIVTALSEIQPMYDSRDQLLDKARQVSLLMDLRGAEAGEREIIERQELNREKYREKNAAVEEMHEKKQQLQNYIDAVGEKTGFYIRTEGLYQWYADRRGLKHGIGEKRKNLDAVDDLIKDRRRAVLLGADELSDFVGTLDLAAAARMEETVSQLVESIRTESDLSQPDLHRIPFDEVMEKVQKRMAQLEKEGARHDAQRLLLSYSRELKDGEPCPLCGAMEHPAPLHLDHEQMKESGIRGTEGGSEPVLPIEPLFTQLRQLRDKLLSSRGDIKGLFSQLSDSRKQKDRIEEEIASADRDLQKHLSGFSWTEFDPEDEEGFNEASREAGEAQKQSKSMAAEMKQLDGTLKEVSEELKNIRNAQEKENEERVRIQEKIKGLRENIAPDIEKTYGRSTDEEIKSAAEEFETGYAELESNYRQLKQDQQDIIEKLNRLRGAIKQKHSYCSAASDRIAGLSGELRVLLRSSQYNSLHAIRTVLSREIDQEEERQEIESFFRKHETVTRRMEELRKKLGTFEDEYDQQEHTRIREEFTTAEHRVSELTETKGELKRRSTDLSDQLEKKKQLEMELKQVDQRIDNFNILLALFKGKGFIDFVATRYLHELCSLANSRFFHLTHKHMRLEVNEENEFVIRDFLNGGRTRSVKTLSGGQLFQASFSLALALADSIQQNREGFFFIDEGFGALDQESIQEVCTTLKSLRRENRVVGVISHLEQLRNEIPVYLRVENKPETGSIVSPRWE